MAWVYKIGVQVGLTQAEMENNANIIYSWGMREGFTLEAISALCGYLQKESTLNPGVKQGESETSPVIGWGMLQWTPATVLTQWCRTYGYDWYDGYAQLERIRCEGEGIKGAGGAFYPGGGYNYTWSEIKKLTDMDEFIHAYFFERGRGYLPDADFEGRLKYAKAWYDIFSGKPPVPSELNRRLLAAGRELLRRVMKI